MRRLLGLGLTLALISVEGIAAAATPEVVLNDPAVNERVPSASDGYLVWSADSEARPNRTNSYVMADGGDPVRVNPAGTQSFEAAIDGTTVAYQQVTSDGADIWFYDVLTEERTPAPSGVNTPNWESRPTLSGNWLLFTRLIFSSKASVRVVLFNLMTDVRIVLREVPSRRHYLVSDQVNGDWATFESCRYMRGRFSNCQVFRYQISTEELVKLPNPGVQQYGGAVSADGTVYLVRTRNRNHWVCGSHTKLVRMDGGNGTVIATLPDGRDSLTPFALDETGGSTTLYLDRYRCRSSASGIYRIPDADSATL